MSERHVLTENTASLCVFLFSLCLSLSAPTLLSKPPPVSSVNLESAPAAGVPQPTLLALRAKVAFLATAAAKGEAMNKPPK
jgi:hypothetical protein